MRPSPFSLVALTCVVAMLCAKCGGAPSSLGPSARVPDSSTYEENRDAHALSGDLLYASDATAGQVVVFSYPQGKYEMTLTDMSHPRGECVDDSNNIYVTNETTSYGGNIFIFAHGASSPTTVLNFPDATAPFACSVEPTTGDLAVANRTLEVWIYDPSTQEWSQDIDIYMAIETVAYDSHGDLFVGGANDSGYFELAEIAHSCFCTITLDQNIGAPGDQFTLQWHDGSLSLTDVGAKHVTVYRIRVSKTGGKIVSATKLRRNRRDEPALGYSYIQKSAILVPHRSGKAIAVWNLEKGGLPRRNIVDAGHAFVGVSVSQGSQRSRGPLH